MLVRAKRNIIYRGRIYTAGSELEIEGDALIRRGLVEIPEVEAELEPVEGLPELQPRKRK